MSGPQAMQHRDQQRNGQAQRDDGAESPAQTACGVGEEADEWRAAQEAQKAHAGHKGDAYARGDSGGFAGETVAKRHDRGHAVTHKPKTQGGRDKRGEENSQTQPRCDGKPAQTHYEILQQAGPYTLLRLTLETGRTHQIRVHMAYMGHPLAGDFLYGRELPGILERPALHSANVSFLHPITKKRLEFSLPLPQDMMQLLT